ncbi:MAG: ubiquinone/menaquinone biosynthesis methyltransferase [Planctomycetota bacterium]
MPDPAQVRSMFARIAGRYDLLNRTLSLGIDQRWRRAAVARAGELRGSLVVDACSGTGDLAVLFARAGARVIGVDFTREMLARGPAKLRASDAPTAFVQGDLLRLPLPSGVADVASVAFGIRNVADPQRGLRELARVVRPGGRVLVLEFSTPRRGPLAWAYRAYFTRVLPTVGRLVSGDGEAYDYLPRSVLAWPVPEVFQGWMGEAGLVDCGHRLLTGGIACLHWGTARAGTPRAGTAGSGPLSSSAHPDAGGRR